MELPEGHEGVPVPSFDGFFDDDVGDDEDDESEEWNPPMEKEKKTTTVKLEWANPRSYIKSLVEIMDWRKMSIRDAYEILLTMFIKGGGSPQDPHISYATVQRIVEEVRNEAVTKIQRQDFPDNIILHFDGVVVSLGASQGKRRIEHLSVTATGLGREWKIGVFEIRSGKGIHLKRICF